MELEIVYEDIAHPVTYIRPYDEFMDGRFERVEVGELSDKRNITW